MTTNPTAIDALAAILANALLRQVRTASLLPEAPASNLAIFRTTSLSGAPGGLTPPEKETR